MAGFEQSLGLGLQQTLSPQMQQSLQLLQAPVLELRNLVEQELQVNPVLEEEVPERELEDEKSEEWDEELQEVSRLDEEWRDYMSQSGAYDGRSAEAQERRDYLLNSIRTPKSLPQHLLDQLAISDIGEEEREVADAIVGNLNDAGLLDVTVEELASLTNTRVENVERVLKEVQALDPVGVAARDLRECLLIQLERIGKRESLEARIVNGHLDDLLKRRFPEVARRLGVGVHDVQDAADFLATLEPRPARQFSISTDQVIQPDVVVEEDGEGFVVSLNNEHVPMLRISTYYKDLLSEPGNRGQVRDYIREKIKGGRFFIKCIQQRQQTILNIAREIVRRQENFLREGPSALRPMTMNQVAQAVGDHREPGDERQIHPHPAGHLRDEIFLHARLPDRGRLGHQQRERAQVHRRGRGEGGQAPSAQRPGDSRDSQGPRHSHRTPHRGQIPRAARHPAEPFAEDVLNIFQKAAKIAKNKPFVSLAIFCKFSPT
jgi:RNA polymerase sigma-54 factor